MQCGEKFYTDAVSATLERITNMAREISAEILMTDYEKCDVIEVVR